MDFCSILHGLQIAEYSTAAKICLESHIYTYTDFKKMLTKLINEKKTNRSETLPEHKNIRGKSHYE